MFWQTQPESHMLHPPNSSRTSSMEAEEADSEYSETIEMSTMSALPSEVVLRPHPKSSHSETEFGTYVNLDMVRPRSDPCLGVVNKGASVSTHSPTSTFKRYSTIEESDILHSEIISIVPPIREKYTSTDEILPRTPDTDKRGSEILDDDSLSLRRRLKIKKRRLNFLEYAIYAMVAVFEEVEKFIVLDAAFLIFSVFVSSLGCTRLDHCRASPRVPVVMVVSGAVDAVANLSSIAATSCRRRHWEECLRDISRMGRLVMFFIHIYCLSVVYFILPPDEQDSNSQYYCDSLTFWTAFSYFNFTFFSAILIWTGMLVSAVWFYF